ncbi:aldehyde dehydrogenase [Candidatus Uabimicrobium sp. HlEnr_7]|uniref:aldehyde dehydrogenase n=1 Tax=Candidatus Uabimicrobium helgolandensis TaxID=3095367 RepID=UPI003556DBA5
MKILTNYIDGKLVSPSSNEYIDIFNPAEGKIYAKAPRSCAKDIENAVSAAQSAFSTWSRLSVDERSGFLLRIAEKIEQRHQGLALAETNDNGKPLWLSKAVDIPRAAANFRFFATAVEHFCSESYSNEEITNYTLRQPIGVVGCISPWNLPLYLFTWKIAPALAAGNCVIAKPSEITPVTAYMLSEICEEVGLPRGVLNIVHGYGAEVGAAITLHKKIPVISFTGGSKTGAQIAQSAAPLFKKISLELGGKNPNIIFDDCNFERMISETVRSSFVNQGQICLCGSRIFVEKSIYNKFIDAFVAKTKELTIGDPLDPEIKQGAIVSEDHMQKILSYFTIAKKEGGTILCGGKTYEAADRCKDGWFIEPTVITDLGPHSRINQEEIFGPVVSVVPFETEEQALEFANCTPYGLSATVWTENLTRAHRFSRDLQAGVVWVNCWLVRDLRTPFGGMKQSGVGREGGLEALRFFTEPKNVSIYHGP